MTDPFGNTSSATYDSYYLTAISATDPIGNSSSCEIDYRTMSPWRMTDANGNRSAVTTDAFGRVTAMAVMGKTGSSDGDTLEDPTVEFEYGDFAWVNDSKPTWTRTRSRETHGSSSSTALLLAGAFAFAHCASGLQNDPASNRGTPPSVGRNGARGHVSTGDSSSTRASSTARTSEKRSPTPILPDRIGCGSLCVAEAARLS